MFHIMATCHSSQSTASCIGSRLPPLFAFHCNVAIHTIKGLRSIIVMVLSSTTSLVMSADCTLMETKYLVWGTRVMMLYTDRSLSILLENSISAVSIFLHSILYPSKSESGGIQEQAMAVEFCGRQCKLCILSGPLKQSRSRINNVHCIFWTYFIAQRCTSPYES